MTLAQLAYLPTLAIWGMAFVAGPGFAVGVDTAVSPAGTQLGVIPGIPVLGALPESTTPWLLLLALLPVALGAFAGWVTRSRLVAPPVVVVAEPQRVLADWDAAPEAARSSALTALLSGVDATRSVDTAVEEETDGAAIDADDRTDPIGARAVIALGIAALSAAGAALLALLASGSIGPGRLSEVGPQPGAVALAVGVEVLLGAAILLLSPRRRPAPAAAADPARPAAAAAEEAPIEDARPADEQTVEVPAGRSLSEADTAPIALVPPTPRSVATGPDSTPTADLGPRRPTPLPPID